MKGSQKANLLIFLMIATLAFTLSLTFANQTIHPHSESYKLISIENDSFEPAYINKVPTIKPKNTTNSTNSTNKNTTTVINKTIEKTDKDYDDDVEE